MSPELAAAITAAVGAFLDREPARSTAPRAGISAWRKIARAGFDSSLNGWREYD